MGNGREAARTVLCVDVGNSDTNLGLFADGHLVGDHHAAHDGR